MSLEMLSFLGGVLVVLIVAFFYSLTKADRVDIYDKLNDDGVYCPAYQVSNQVLGQYCDQLIKRDKSGKFFKLANLLGVNIELLQDQINLLNMQEMISAVEIFALKVFGIMCGIVIGIYAFLIKDITAGAVGIMIFAALYCLPTEEIKDRLKKRESQIVMELPQFIEQCYMCIEAGAPLQEALITIADNNEGVLGSMFRDAFAKSSYGGRWEEELYQMVLGIKIEALEDFVNDILISHAKGTPIHDTLRSEVTHIHKITAAKQAEMISKLNTKQMLLFFIFAMIPSIVIIGMPMLLQVMQTM